MSVHAAAAQRAAYHPLTLPPAAGGPATGQRGHRGGRCEARARPMLMSALIWPMLMLTLIWQVLMLTLIWQVLMLILPRQPRRRKSYPRCCRACHVQRGRRGCRAPASRHANRRFRRPSEGHQKAIKGPSEGHQRSIRVANVQGMHAPRSSERLIDCFHSSFPKWVGVRRMVSS